MTPPLSTSEICPDHTASHFPPFVAHLLTIDHNQKVEKKETKAGFGVMEGKNNLDHPRETGLKGEGDMGEGRVINCRNEQMKGSQWLKLVLNPDGWG